MDIDLPAEDDPRRREVRAWFAEHPHPTPQELVDAGYVVPHWPPPWGLDAEPELQLIIDDELKRAGVSRPLNPIGIGTRLVQTTRATIAERTEVLRADQEIE